MSLTADEEATNEEIIASVERMLAMERNAQKVESKKGAAMKTLDMNEGLVANIAADDDDDARLQRGQTITRKKLDVKADNINQVFADNIDVIADQVNTFAQMEEETVANDPTLQYEK